MERGQFDVGISMLDPVRESECAEHHEQQDQQRSLAAGQQRCAERCSISLATPQRMINTGQ
jgi:hypothetical protein